MNAGRLKWRGATSAPFPGYLLIGRGQDFATTLTSASADIIDQYAETLCGGSDTSTCTRASAAKMEQVQRRHAQRRTGRASRPRSTARSSVTRRSTARKVAISAKRSSYGKDVARPALQPPPVKRRGQERRETFYKAAAKTPQTFNSFYIDNKRHRGVHQRTLPMRTKNVDPGLLTKGTGKYEWKGFLKRDEHPHGIEPDGRHDGQLEQHASPTGSARPTTSGAAAERSPASTCWTRTSASSADKKGKWNLAAVTSAMNAGATQDIRAIDTVPLLGDLLNGIEAADHAGRGDAEADEDWRSKGGSRLDLDLDGKIDDPGAASWTARGRRSPTRSWSRRSGPSSTSWTRCSRGSTRRRAVSTPAGTSTSTATSRAAQAEDAPFRVQLLRQRQRTSARMRSGPRSPTLARRSRPSRAPPIPPTGVRRDQGADQVRSAPAGHDGVHEPPERIPAGHQLHGHRP